ncbi:MAG: hypothetical protein CXT77_00660 [uncultured DHVE6 group euryarchaeote]|jgi:hypothetical protein|nr:MAG: hypothetical protein CXT77_00660 [uncultured DHVE6 group euryarchaeote]
MDVEFSEKKLDLKERRRFQELIEKSPLTRQFKSIRLRLKRYGKQGKRTKYAITGEAETQEGKVIRAEGVDWRFGMALKELFSKLIRQSKKKR